LISKGFSGLDTRRLLLTILFALIFTMAVRVPTDTDTWWHLRSGEYIVRTHSIPRHDVFSHTVAGKPWIDHGWLAQIAIYLLYAAFGYAGLGLALTVAILSRPTSTTPARSAVMIFQIFRALGTQCRLLRAILRGR